MDTFPLAGFDGYAAQTVTFSSTQHGDIKLDVAYPENTDGTPSTVLLHYHGGSLVFGDRYSFLPYWLVHACVSRKWIFVTPDYRLMPEVTTLDTLQDATDAYEWVLASLPKFLGRSIAKVILAGSSSGGYLAVATAAAVKNKPDALLSIYGMLDTTIPRYTTPGPPLYAPLGFDTGPVLKMHPMASKNDDRPALSGYPMPEDLANDTRLPLIEALHIDGLFLDYMAGVEGLGQAVAKQGPEAIPEHLRKLFPVALGDLRGLPQTMIVHGKNDAFVPPEQSVRAVEKLRAAGVEVQGEFPENAPHGFDCHPGDFDVETSAGECITAFKSLRNVIAFLDQAVTKS